MRRCIARARASLLVPLCLFMHFNYIEYGMRSRTKTTVRRRSLSLLSSGSANEYARV